MKDVDPNIYRSTGQYLRNVDPIVKNESIHNYRDWLRRARPNERYEYYKGLSPQESYIASVVAREVYTDYERGLVYPFSKRHGEGNYTYLVVRSQKKVN